MISCHRPGGLPANDPLLSSGVSTNSPGCWGARSKGPAGRAPLGPLAGRRWPGLWSCQPGWLPPQRPGWVEDGPAVRRRAPFPRSKLNPSWPAKGALLAGRCPALVHGRFTGRPGGLPVARVGVFTPGTSASTVDGAPRPPLTSTTLADAGQRRGNFTFRVAGLLLWLPALP